MEEIYEKPEHPASFSGVEALYRAAKGKIKRSEIRKWLQGVDTYTLHKPIRRKFKTNRVIVYGIDHQWQADLVDMSALQEHNDGVRYILTCIDILSKYAWAIPMKTKTGKEMVEVFQKIFAERKPKSLQTDQGTEFKNVKFQAYLKREQVRFFTTYNATKASVIERFNRTLKSKMWKYFTSKNTHRYLDVLDKFLDSYNHAFHSSIRKTPAEVNSKNEAEVWMTLYENLTPPTKCIFQPGDTVRISKAKLTFEKGYTANWTSEIFVVSECVKRDPSVYRLKDLMGEPILGTFYSQELQKVKMKEYFPIEKIIRKRKRNGQVEYLVQYTGYGPKFNQWVSASDLTSL